MTCPNYFKSAAAHGFSYSSAPLSKPQNPAATHHLTSPGNPTITTTNIPVSGFNLCSLAQAKAAALVQELGIAWARVPSLPWAALYSELRMGGAVAFPKADEAAIASMFSNLNVISSSSATAQQQGSGGQQPNVAAEVAAALPRIQVSSCCCTDSGRVRVHNHMRRLYFVGRVSILRTGTGRVRVYDHVRRLYFVGSASMVIVGPLMIFSSHTHAHCLTVR